eukprot:365396-Chlamydomonas_euryale.AAC.4
MTTPPKIARNPDKCKFGCMGVSFLVGIGGVGVGASTALIASQLQTAAGGIKEAPGWKRDAPRLYPAPHASKTAPPPLFSHPEDCLSRPSRRRRRDLGLAAGQRIRIWHKRLPCSHAPLPCVNLQRPMPPSRLSPAPAPPAFQIPCLHRFFAYTAA